MRVHEAKGNLRRALLQAALVCGGSILALQQASAAPTTIWSFTGGGGDGEYPYGQLVFDSSGAIYGTAESGGTSYNGTVFQLIPPAVPGGAWSENVLYRFAGGTDGRQPSTGVLFGSNGALYGTTFNGGSPNCGGGCGTVFQLTPPSGGGVWTHTVLYAFTGPLDGASPGRVVFGPNGSLFGTNGSGGPASTTCRRVGCGTVFELTQAKNGTWSKTILHSFPAQLHDGYHPNTDLAVDSSGKLYGTTYNGGNSNYGTVFMMTPPSGGGGWTETVLYSFTGGSDGGYPVGGVVVGSNGVLYGTASYSGVANDSGTVFQLTPPAAPGGAWTFQLLHTFAGGKDGATPFETLALDPSGNLYGTTLNGGSSACYQGCGTVFKLAPPAAGSNWTETVLADFANSGQTNSSIVTFRNGLLYGTTYYLGAANVGSTFTLGP